MAENPHLWSDYDSNSSRLGSAASFFGDSMSHSSGILTENSSLFSMSEDDFDQLATLKAREMFDEVDRILYENSENGSLEITKECQEWKSKFPHLRIVGHKMFESIDHGFRRYSPADVMFNDANSNMSSMLDQCSDFSNMLNGLSIRGERMNARQFDMNFHAGGGGGGSGGGGGQMVASEEVIDHDGDYEEIFALDYNSDERRSMYGSSRGYPPITPINSLRDFIVSTLSNKLLADVSPHVVDLVRQCKTKQTSIVDERCRDKENVKVDERSNASTPRIVLLPSPLKTRNEEFLFGSHHVNSRNFSFKPSDLQVVPEDSGLDAILTVRQMRSSRDVSPLSPSMHIHHLDHKTSSRTEKSKSLFPSNGMDSSPRMSKGDNSGKTFSSNHRIDVWKQPLPRIQQKPLTASNNNIDGTKEQTPQRASSALHSGRDQFSARQHLGFNSRFGDKLGYKFDYGRPSSTQTYYNNKVESRLGIQSPAVSSSRIILPELEERNRLHSSDPSNKSQFSRRKTNLSSTMPQIHDNHAGRRRGTLPSKSRPNLVPFR